MLRRFQTVKGNNDRAKAVASLATKLLYDGSLESHKRWFTPELTAKYERLVALCSPIEDEVRAIFDARVN